MGVRTRLRFSSFVGASRKELLKASQTYSDMLGRCNNINHRLYHCYGGAGIQVEIPKEDFFVWFLKEYKTFQATYPETRQSVNRKDHSKSYTLENIELIPHLENSRESLKRNGNMSKWGTKLDEIQCLVIYTFPASHTNLLKELYKVNYQTVRNVRVGINRPALFKMVHDA
jgi:hypothetical protein